MSTLGRYSLNKPSALALSPTGDRFAVADEHVNRVFIVQTNGRLAWIAGETGYLIFPKAVCFVDDATILVVTEDLQVLRVLEAAPDICDTIANLAETTKRSQVREVTHLLPIDGGYLVVDPDNGHVVQLDSAWAFAKVLVGHGHGKGKVWEPTGMQRDLSGKLVISDRGDNPLQVFSPSGSILFSADWNAPDRQRTWEASAVTITRQETIWVSDLSSRAWRLYDQTGTSIGEFPFSPPGLLPLEIAATSDNRLIVVEERGTISIWSLSL